MFFMAKYTTYLPSLSVLFKKWIREFTKWIKTLIKNSKWYVFNGAKTTPYFQQERGTRQGDPLSAFSSS